MLFRKLLQPYSVSERRTDFHELVRGEKERRAFLNEILDVMTLTGGERSHDV